MRLEEKHIFITGSNGFIGSHLLGRLVQEGFEVTILLREGSNTSRIETLLNKSQVRRIAADHIESYFENTPPSTILHLATCYRKYHTADDIEEMIASNVTFPTQIAQLAVSHGVKYFINTGSFFEYDFTDAPLTEQSREKAFNLYASTKLAFNSVLRYYTEQYDFRALTLRLFSPYGPRDNEKLIPVAIRSLIEGQEMKIQNATQRLSFTYVDDIVDAYMLALKHIQNTKKSFDFVNIAPRETHSLKEAIQLLQDIAGKTLNVTYGDGQESDIWHSSFGSDYAERTLGWYAKTSLEEGLRLTYNDYKDAI